MSIFPHTVAGAVAGSFFQNPALSFVAGVASHLLLDYIPHYDPDSKTKKLFYRVVVTTDLTLSFIVLIILLPIPNLFWGAAGGALVDGDNFLQLKWPKVFPLLSKVGINVHTEGSRWHNKLKLGSTLKNLIVGIILQLIVVLSGFFYLYNRV